LHNLALFVHQRLFFKVRHDLVAYLSDQCGHFLIADGRGVVKAQMTCDIREYPVKCQAMDVLI
jgi:hypothetical protein